MSADWLAHEDVRRDEEQQDELLQRTRQANRRVAARIDKGEVDS